MTAAPPGFSPYGVGVCALIGGSMYGATVAVRGFAHVAQLPVES
jgi:hypothetical protein